MCQGVKGFSNRNQWPEAAGRHSKDSWTLVLCIPAACLHCFASGLTAGRVRKGAGCFFMDAA